jgi:hypothetical protein
MAGADVIEAAIGITLLLIVSYVVLGSITSAADTVSNARKDITLSQTERRGTNIEVTYAHTETFVSSPDHYRVRFRVQNTGNVKIDFTKMGVVIVMYDPDRPTYYRFGSGNNFEWNLNYLTTDESCNTQNDVVNPNQWDPGEYLCGFVDMVYTSCGSWGCPPVVFYAFTGNGASDSRYT